MSLTIRYLGLTQEDINYIRNAVGTHQVYFFQVGDSTTLTANGDMDDMLAILAVTSKFKHQDLVMRQN